MADVNYKIAMYLCLLGAVAFFNLALVLRRLKLREVPLPSFAHLSFVQRQKRKRIAIWIAIANGCIGLGGAVFFWLRRIEIEIPEPDQSKSPYRTSLSG